MPKEEDIKNKYNKYKYKYNKCPRRMISIISSTVQASSVLDAGVPVLEEAEVGALLIST